MNENFKYSYEENEREINLVDLMYYLLKKWKTLIIAILIGAIMGGTIYAMKKFAADRAATALEVNMKNAAVGVEDDLTVDELKAQYQITEDQEANMELAYQYRQLCRKQLEYNLNSPIMQINPNAVYSGKLEYYVSAGYDTGMIAVLYQNILSESGILDELKDAAVLPYKEQYIQELVSCSVSRENDSSVDVNSDVRDVCRTAVITFTINAPSKEKCEQMLQVIRDKVSEIDRQCLEKYDDYSLMQVNDSINLVVSSDYLNSQKTSVDQLNACRSAMSSLENSFTEEETAYYNQVYLSGDYGLEKEEMADETMSTVVVQSESPNLIKWVIVCIFVMCVIWGGYGLLKYLLDKTIKTPDEIRSCYGLPVIGVLKTDVDSKKGLDGWLDRMRNRSWGSDDTVENIGNMVNAMNLYRLFLCVEGGGEKLKKAAASICEYTKGMTLSGTLAQNGDVIAEAKESDGVILAVEIGGTFYSEIERELEICQMQNVAVKGFIVIS